MLTTIEKIIFIALALISAGFTFHGFKTIVDSIRKGRSAPELKNVPMSLVKGAVTVLFQRTIFKARKGLSAIHMGLFFGLITYAFVNLFDVLEGLVPGFDLVYGGKHIPNAPTGLVNAFNLIADVMSMFLLVAIIVFFVRRFIVKDKALTFRENILLNPKVKAGAQNTDSLIVDIFVIMHVIAHVLSQAYRLTDGADPFMPFASFLNSIFGASQTGVHVAWWVSLGWVMFIIPYLSRSKHTHFFMSPINLGLAKQNPRGQLDAPAKVDPGAKFLHDLSWKRVLDSYACVQCNRCQDVCPANFYGRPLSPSALEVNKRYLLKEATFGSHPDLYLLPLTETVISPEAVWSCTTCYACVRVCPVGNEPMADIVDIRRRMLVDGAELDSGVQNALQSLATNGNWMSKGKRLRGRWAKEMEFPVKNATEEPVEHLWFVGDTASFDERVIPNTKMVARLFNQGGLDFGIMYQNESNAGNDVRRVGEEGLFEQLVEQNMEAFGKAQFKQIVTTDPHSFNTLKNEYPQFGGKFEVKHYTVTLLKLFEEGKLTIKNKLSHYKVTFHDPCYLGRYNGGFTAPRKLLELLGVEFVEMPRNCENSFCCGAGGGQIWMGKVAPGERPAENRIKEALSTFGESANAKTQLFVVTCPKDMVMYSDAVKTTGNEGRIEVRDMIQLVAEGVGVDA
ncbi:MAG TPA: (Fe-S)-binding protein [Anaerolineales bacterium]|nr:(Fe-S)-binding protein [Anaerolineales bacterium]HNQ95616.1 (Fe-S)-binding protein [Anaerolineales bacterium]HNS59605.1 (Fe-S)-binding protein [Anaerolineales bacterium]